MAQMYLKQQVFAIRNKFTFYDAYEQEIYKGKGALFAFPQTYEVVDHADRPMVRIERKMFTFLAEFSLEDVYRNKQIGRIKKRFKLLKNELDFETPHGNYEILGSFFAYQFSVVNGAQQTLIQVQKELLTWGDTYQITYDETKIEPHVVAGIIIALDCAYHDNKNNG